MSAATHCQRCGVELSPPKASDHRRKWCSERCRKAQYAGTCERCGNPTGGSNGYDAPRVCHSCDTARFLSEKLAREKAHRAQIEALWAEGKTAREIATVLGWEAKRPNAVIVNLRARGADLPPRRTPEQIARITANSSENLRKARAARRQEAAA